MTDQISKSAGASPAVFRILTPIMAAVLAGFLIIGIALPVLPLHVTDDLGYGAFVVGLVAGAQFIAALVSRVWAGAFSDRYGPKAGVITGLTTAIVAGLLYLLSLALAGTPLMSVIILIVGRAVLGGAESFIITGGVSWGLGRVDDVHAGKVIAWVGTAMFAAMALGGPLGSLLFSSYGFVSIALATALIPLAVLVALIQIPAVPLHPAQSKKSALSVLGSVWLPGLGAAFASIGYCAILTFSSLYYDEQEWHPIWLAFSAFGLALIFARLVAGHWPDKFGGARIALTFVLVQTLGLLILWLASNAFIASCGAALAGFGYALVYPGLGVEAVRGSSAANRGLAMGLYTVFLDIAMAIGSPALGWIAGWSGLDTIFAASALVVACTALIAARLIISARE
ncbi:arabinose transporter [Cohaesibacter haloalkalitolerans]|uniref:arabinose transporter n=1 Tax=Cohaesibacter haloalkalitolerans TaxID=1162980 RepID=UPI000E64980E|nr:arabinose transporter [Cohaesibacter haloalkalitolerans]